MLNYDEVLSRLISIQDIWTFDSRSITSETFDSLQHFLKKQKTIHSEQIKSETFGAINIAYHQSIIHFLLYYAYYPKIPFIISKKNQLVFGSFYGKNYNKIELSFPEILNSESIISQLNLILSLSSFQKLLQDAHVNQVLLRDVTDEMAHNLRFSENFLPWQLSSLREISYKIYNVKKTLNKKGKQFANLRWHLNKFHNENHAIESVSLHDHVKPVIHLIGSWKRNAIQKRGFSFINVRSDKQAARLFGSISINNRKNFEDSCRSIANDCIIRVLKIDGKIRSFNFGYPLGVYSKQNVFAHAIGISDLSIPHLAEYAQYDFWKQIHKEGYGFVNDGPSWKTSLEVYKQKFRPIDKRRYYFTNLKI
jgi:hypothetical protein